MNTILQNTSATLHEMTHQPITETPVPATAACGLAVAIDLLAAAGLAADAVYDGDADGCPHCMSQVLSEAA